MMKYHNPSHGHRIARSANVIATWILVIFGSNIFAADVAKPPVKPAVGAKPAVAAPSPAAMAALAKASAELVKEATAEFAKPEPKLREKSDYFSASPSAEITTDAMLATLEKPQSPDPKIDAYVRWQLLSAAIKPFEGDQIAKAIALFRKLPEPVDHPGLRRDKLQSAVEKVGKDKKNTGEQFTTQVKEQAEKVKIANKHIVLLRNDLFLRLPVNNETLLAGLDEISVRLKHCDIEDAGGLLDHIVKTMQPWAKDATVVQRNNMIAAINSVKAKSLDQRNQPYILCEFNAQANQLFWRALQVNEKTFLDAVDSLIALNAKDAKKK